MRCTNTIEVNVITDPDSGAVKSIYSCITPDDCPKGTFREQGGNIECQECGLGTYNSKVGQDNPESCKKCPPGLICN